MHLATPIHTYFTARAPQDGDALAAAFAPDAIVHDEGHSHHGPQAIRDCCHRAEPAEVAEAGGKTVVKGNVTGDFPGSPAMLTFTFGLNGDGISYLEIG